MLWGAFENPVEHIPGVVGGGTVAAVLTSLVWGYIYKRREDRRDREQSVAEAQTVIEKWKEYADAVKEHADDQICRARADASAEIGRMRMELEGVEARLKDCEDDRDALHRAKRKLQNRVGVLESKLDIAPPEDDEDSSDPK